LRLTNVSDYLMSALAVLCCCRATSMLSCGGIASAPWQTPLSRHSRLTPDVSRESNRLTLYRCFLV